MSSDLGTTLKHLALALLNATLMLVALILLLAVILVAQLRGLRDDLRTSAQSVQTELAMTRASVRAALEALPDGSIARAELQSRLAALEAAPVVADDDLWRQLALAIITLAARGVAGTNP